MSAEILIIDDNSDIRLLISSLLKDHGFYIRQAANYNQALSEIDKKLPDVAIIDVKLDKGDNDGIELLIHIKKKDIDVPVIIISGHANIKMAVDSLKSGAFEFIQKPFDSQRLINFVNRAVENYGLKKENRNLKNKLFHSYDLIGKSPSIMRMKEQIKKLSLTESRIFIFGPAGSGKELVARKIHKNSNRAKKSLIILNGALLDPEKYELELFGSENNDGTILYGALEKASNGILLIDEVSEIPLETQAKILRVLTDQKFKRLNGNHDINVNVRIICTTSKDINKEIEDGNFREDLYHRLNVVPINLEPLKNRTEDIPLLIDYFSRTISYSYGVPKFEIDINNPYLFEYDWPGNVRELRNLVERIAILSPNEKNDNINMIINESLKKVSINK
ncbi:MAG: sigma-54 dependent transcriptional regulator, partial [Candidatus Pelagibacter bacterium]|nr:sigma-54 dependent transcriptional regulator [Candidatus Pelagibacter bacterium]